jgi:hypothetical protein
VNYFQEWGSSGKLISLLTIANDALCIGGMGLQVSMVGI